MAQINKDKRVALMPGSYDPLTIGHVDLIRQAAEQFERVIVAVMINADKEYLFSIDERAEIARRSLAHLPNVEVITDESWLYLLFDRVGADVIVKGIRNETDLAYEEKMALYNKEKNPRIVTEYLYASEEFKDISSTAARKAYTDTGDMSEYLAEGAREYVKNVLSHK